MAPLRTRDGHGADRGAGGGAVWRAAWGSDNVIWFQAISDGMAYPRAAR